MLTRSQHCCGATGLRRTGNFVWIQPPARDVGFGHVKKQLGTDKMFRRKVAVRVSLLSVLNDLMK
jgi:hypothetical protein